MWNTLCAIADIVKWFFQSHSRRLNLGYSARDKTTRRMRRAVLFFFKLHRLKDPCATFPEYGHGLASIGLGNETSQNGAV